MAKSYEVLNYLRPNGGWIQRGEDFDGIEFIEAKPLTREEYEKAFPIVDAIIAKKKNEEDTKRKALLEKLGITEEEAKLLLS